MAGTKAGAKKAMITIRERYGVDYWRRIGSIGGKRGFTGGFYGDPELASAAGKLGGRRKGGEYHKRKGKRTTYAQLRAKQPIIIPPKPTLITRMKRKLHVG